MSQITVTTESAEVVARDVLDRLEDAWNRGDGPAFGAAYADDASFVTIRGEHHVGSDAIAGGHAAIFATVYAGSTNRLDLISSREVADGVVVAVSRNTLTAPTGPLQGRHAAMSTSVLVRVGGRWRIVATHNTVVAGP